MLARIFAAFLAIIASSASFANGLSGAVLPCSDTAATIKTIPADIATAVVRSLLGTAIDAAVNYLDDPKVAKFDVVIPVDSVGELTSGTKCIYISSGHITPTKQINGHSIYSRQAINSVDLFLKFQISKSSTAGSNNNHPLRASILTWKYGKFLNQNCPFLRQCSKRDIVMKLGLMIPASSAANTSHASEPFGFLIENATIQDVQGAVKLKNGAATLPWITFAEPTGPVNVRFELIETSQPNTFTKALAAAVNAQKANIQDTVEHKIKGISDHVAASAAQTRVTEASKAFEEYKKAYDAARTTLVAYGTASDEHKKYLAAQYTIQKKSVELTETLGQAAFELADLNWPSGGLGALPSL